MVREGSGEERGARINRSGRRSSERRATGVPAGCSSRNEMVRGVEMEETFVPGDCDDTDEVEIQKIVTMSTREG